ncbi:hypothetical protein QWZ03_19840 [Chitinimonas viridis]|uniref:Uncharacterized protein n=1 Tax=Chitinimonas viridis TaxID=664880 RepID=A0ABT8B9V2_9NEIS|nr:hypothetical protein [Chitinimonas viridis]MDN3579024.1 hypothetical protein [Chitinimonas viridis]
MAKQAEDRMTMELPLDGKAKAKVGRKPIGSKAMTAAERKRRSRQNSATRSVDFDKWLLAYLRPLAEARNVTVTQLVYLMASGLKSGRFGIEPSEAEIKNVREMFKSGL